MVDYNLANQSGAQFRAELNLILAALQSCAYGATAPATTTAGQFWVDASGESPVLRVRNALNSGWTPLGTLAPGGFELAGTSEAGRALIASTTIAAQRAALGLGGGATAGMASEAQALAGTDNAVLMTPLRTRQAMAALGGMTLLGTLTTTSGNSQTLSGLDLTGCTALLILVEAVSHADGSNNRALTIEGTAVSSARSAGDSLNGHLLVNLNSGMVDGIVSHSTGVGGASQAWTLIATSLRRTSTSLTFGFGGTAAFDAGILRIHGIE